MLSQTTTDEFNLRSDAVAERMKELRCLYSISSMLKGRHADLGNILQKIADILPAAWQYPELACASITLKSRCYCTQDHREPKWHQQAEINVEGESVGLLEIGYHDALPNGCVPGFLPEEHSLLCSVADRIGEVIALKETQNRLWTYQEHLRSLAAELTMTEERERRSLAIKLHDRIGQGLAVAKFKIESLKHLLPAHHHASLDDVSSLIKQIVSDTRSLTFEISPPILYELGLQQAIAWLGEQMERQYGLRVEVCCDEGPIELSEGVRIMIFRSIQELLTNTVKHAEASRVTLRLSIAGRGLQILVEDDGLGFDAASRSQYPSAAGGFGLFSIRERIGHLGGEIEIESSPGNGTRIRLAVASVDVPAMPVEEQGDEDSTRR